MQGEGKTLKGDGTKIKRGFISQKRPIKVYEDSENPDAGKRLKTNHNSAQCSGLGRVRKPLADINNIEGGVKVGNGVKKGQLARNKKAEQSSSSMKRGAKKAKTDVVKKTVGKENPTSLKVVEEVKTGSSETLKEDNLKNDSDEVATVSLQDTILKKEERSQQNQNVFYVSYYGADIYKYLFSIEKKYEIPKNHLEGQVLNGLMRAVLVDWLAGVVHQLDLMQETFQLTVYILDKFMSINKTTTKANAQLVGLGALFVAAKYEETEAVEFSDLQFFCDKKWTGDEIKSMESEILKTVNFQLGRPLAVHFVRRLSKISGASPMEHSYSKFFADTALLSYQLCHIKPSIVAAASVFISFCVSRDRIDNNLWTSTLALASTYELNDFRNLLPHIARAVTGAITGELQGLQTRYSHSNLFCVSLMPGCRPQTGIINHF